MVVQGVQRGGGGAGNPSGVGASQWVCHFLAQHVGHQIGHGPHAFANLGASAQAAGQAHQHVVALVGLNPRAAFHVAFAHHGAGLHGGVHLVAGAVKKAGVNKGHAVTCGGNARLEVDAGAALFVHDANFDGGLGQAKHALNAFKNLAGKGHFVGAVHFGLNDVHRALARIAYAVLPFTVQVNHGSGYGDHGVHDALGNFLAPRAPQNGGVGHQVAHVAHEQQRAAVQRYRLAAGAGVHPVGVEAAGKGAPALADLLGEVAAQQAKPIAVGQYLVLGVHGGNRVFQVQDGRQRRLQHQVAHASGVGGANGGAAVDAQIQVNAVVLQQHAGRRARLTLIAHQLLGLRQGGAAAVAKRDVQLALVDAVAGGVQVRALFQWRGAVQHMPCVFNYLGAA